MLKKYAKIACKKEILLGSSFFCSGKRGRKEKRDSFLFLGLHSCASEGSLRKEKWGLSLLRVVRQGLVLVWAAGSNKRTHTLLDKQRAFGPCP